MRKGRSRTREILEHTTEHKWSQGSGSKAEQSRAEQPKQPETSITVAAKGVTSHTQSQPGTDSRMTGIPKSPQRRKGPLPRKVEAQKNQGQKRSV